MKLSLIESMWYVDRQYLTEEEAKDTATRFVEYIQMTPEWTMDEGAYFDDYWYGIAENWDINIYRPDRDVYPDYVVACIYPVIDGECDYNTWIRIYPEKEVYPV